METRTWEQMKANNDTAAWIDENGRFCKDYTGGTNGWKKVGFNGCWSCEMGFDCEKYKVTLER